MGLFKSLVNLTPVGMSYNLAKGAINHLGGGSKSDPNAGLAASNQSLMDNAAKDSKIKQEMYYGDSGKYLGEESTNYTNRLKGGLDENYARADIVNQQGSNERAMANARAGLSGVDLTAQNEQNRRSAGIEANAVNSALQQNALNMYGESIGNRITGMNNIENQNKALAIASQQSPTTQAGSGGLLSNIFGGLF